MDTNMMDAKKKVYNTPELIEHGSLVETTQFNCLDAGYDGLDGAGYGSWDTCI